MKIGIYEQIINQLFEEKISSIDQNRFYIGERVIKKDEVAKLLSMYLTSIFEQVLLDMVDINEETDEEDEQKDSSVKRGLELANSIIRKLVNEFHLDSGNLVSAQAKILTAVIDKTQSDYPRFGKTSGGDDANEGSHKRGSVYRQGDEDVYGVTERNSLS